MKLKLKYLTKDPLSIHERVIAALVRMVPEMQYDEAASILIEPRLSPSESRILLRKRTIEQPEGYVFFTNTGFNFQIKSIHLEQLQNAGYSTICYSALFYAE